MPAANSERAILVGLDLKSSPRTAPASAERYTATESLEELAELARSAGAEVVQQVLQSRDRLDASTLIGSGKVEELRAEVLSSDADLVLIDHDLGPTQQRNLEKALDVKVIDRTQLILDIFASRARTREGRLQVELAQLNYLLPRLSGKGISLSRLGGGIGTRGPGETKLETDRRRISTRIAKLEKDLEHVRSGRSLHRRKRDAVPLPTVALVGYTNAGKSTLFNRVARAGVYADDRMFATLDPTVRSFELPSRRQVLMSDTVGFIRSLPTTLVKAFRATLEEITDASLLLHVVDASSPHAVVHAAHVREVLDEIGAQELAQLLVLNKIDRIEEGQGEISTARIAEAAGLASPQAACPISAASGQGIDALLAAIDQAIPFDPVSLRRFRIPHADGGAVALLHRRGRVLSENYEETECVIEAEVPESVWRQLEDYSGGPVPGANAALPAGRRP